MHSTIVEKSYAFVIITLIIGGAAFLCKEVKLQAERDVVEQQRINAFYSEHHCARDGYVATRNEVVPVYRCDNGVFVARDMK